MSAIKAWMGANRVLSCSLSPSTTHLDALIITSIAMVTANGEIVHPAMIAISNGVVSCVEAQLNILKICFDQCWNLLTDLKVSEWKWIPQQTVWHQSKGISRVQKYHMEVSTFCPCCLNLMPNQMLLCFLYRNVYQAICLQIGDQPPCCPHKRRSFLPSEEDWKVEIGLWCSHSE